MALNITSARYGKDNVRLYKVERDRETNFQIVTEMTVTVLLEGDFASSYVMPSTSNSSNAAHHGLDIPMRTIAEW